MVVLRWLRRGVEALLALLILFEEWGWEPLKRAMAWLMRSPALAWVERGVIRLPPHAALAAFLLPTLLLLPVKLAALWLVGHGQAMLGLAVIVAAKLVGTALLARLFQLTQPALMQLGWFARGYLRWTAWKGALLAQLRASWAWRVGRIVKRRVHQQLARWRQA
jgi:hypothetical protein